MCSHLILLAYFLLALHRSLCAPSGDKVYSLPNLDFTPNFEQYAGYLPLSHSKQLFYWLTMSEKSPSTDPVVLWLNGGPGCSSLQGLFVELGPYRVLNYGANVVSNPYSWNKVANMIFMDAPAGVGFSFNFNGNLTYTDDQVADDNHQALIQFFQKFPEFKSNDFYIAGESYAGTYIPMLASRLIDDKGNFSNFKGLLVGNGCLNDHLLYNTVIQYSYNHAFIDEVYYRTAVAKCCNGKSSEDCDWYQFSMDPKNECFNESTNLNAANYYTGLDPYFLYFSCYLDSQDGTNRVDDMSYGKDPTKNVRNTMTNFLAKKFNYPKHVRDSLPACAHHNNADVYLDRLDVRGAIHVPGNVQDYQECSNTIATDYVVQYTDITPYALKAVKAGLKILFFNGDVDSVCNVIHNAQFIANLNLTLLQPASVWNISVNLPPTAGFWTKYQGIDFITIRGAGHFASSSDEKPREALQMFNNFLKGQDYSTPFSA